jgi:glycosyltransferase involved in cell wall biosynthesis
MIIMVEAFQDSAGNSSLDIRKKRQILCVHTGGNILRGSEYALLEVLRGFHMAGREILLLCDQDVMLEAAIAAGQRAHKIPSGDLMIDSPDFRFNLAAVMRANIAVWRYIKSFRADVIYCNGGRSCQTSFVVAKLAAIPLVAHLHAPYHKRYHLLYGTPWASAVIHCSRSMKEYHESRVRFRRSVLILNGVDFDSLLMTTAESAKHRVDFPPIPRETVVLGFIGSLIPRKGVDILIDAVDRLKKANRLVYLLIGGKEESAIYREHVRKLKLDKYIYFIGEVTDRAQFYSRIDINILPSHSEAFGRTVIEAAACGVPSVAHRVGGIPEAMCEGQFGELYSPNDPAILAKAISHIIDKGDWREKSSLLSDLAEKHFGISRVVKQILTVLDTV